MIDNICVLVAFLIPALVIISAWRRDHKEKISLGLLVCSSVLSIVSISKSARWVLLGPDYSHRLYATIGTNMVMAAVLGVYFGFTRRWGVGFAAAILALDWLYMGAINSVV